MGVARDTAVVEQHLDDIAVVRLQAQRWDDSSEGFHSDAELGSATVNETKLMEQRISSCHETHVSIWIITAGHVGMWW